MTGGYVLADERDVRTVGTLVRRERAAGGVELGRPVVQDATVVNGGPTPATVGFLTRMTRCVIGDPPLTYDLLADNNYGIVLPPGAKLHGTIVVAGELQPLFRQSVNITSAVSVTVEKLNGSNPLGRSYAGGNAGTMINALTLGQVNLFSSFAIALGVPEVGYDTVHPFLAGQYVIMNMESSNTIVFVRATGGFASMVVNARVIWNYSIF